MKKVRTKEELARQFYVNQLDIVALLGVSRVLAKRIYDKADALDNEKYKDDRIIKNKVSMISMCEAYGIRYHDLIKRVNS